jgi:hypothetical protein
MKKVTAQEVEVVTAQEVEVVTVQEVEEKVTVEKVTVEEELSFKQRLLINDIEVRKAEIKNRNKEKKRNNIKRVKILEELKEINRINNINDEILFEVIEENELFMNELKEINEIELMFNGYEY